MVAMKFHDADGGHISAALAAPRWGQTATGINGDFAPIRSGAHECGVGALMPWADALWA